MLMINLESYEIEDIQEYKTVSFELSLFKEMNFKLSDFNEALQLQFKEAMDNMNFNELEGAIDFVIYTDLGFKDLSLMQDFILNRFTDHITLKDIPFHRERRLGIPKGLQNKVKMNVAAILDLVNKFDKIKKINIGISPRSGKTINRIVEEEK